MSDNDIAALAERVTETRRRFLTALADYDKDGPDDEKATIEQFLEKFMIDHPKRARKAKELARNAIDLIQDFARVRTEFVERVARLAAMMQTADLKLALGVLSAAFKPDETSPDTKQSPRIVAGSAYLQDLRTSVNTTGSAALARAAGILRQVAAMHEMAADILLLRKNTLAAFRKDNLGIPLKQLVERLKEQAKSDTRDEVIDQAWSAALDVAAELADIVLEESAPWRKIPRYVRKMKKVFSSARIDVKPDTTDLMLTMQDNLTQQNSLIAKVDEKYQATAAELIAVIEAK